MADTAAPGSAPTREDALLQFLQRMDTRMSAMEAVMGRLSLGQPPAPAPLPEQISPQALAALLAHPSLPPEHRTLLEPVLLCFARLASTLTSAEEQKFQDAYTLSRIAVECPPKAAPPASQARGRAPSASRYSSDGRFYTSRSGNRHDTSGPPPYPCFHCGGNHWALRCPQKNGGPSNAPGGSLAGSKY